MRTPSQGGTLESERKRLTRLLGTGSGGVLSPEVEAEMLICHFADVDRLELFTSLEPLSARARRSIDGALKRRRLGVPLAHLIGRAPFFDRMFFVSPDSLIPRPETERLVEETLKTLSARFCGKTAEILDLGTGSGCIAASLTLDWPDCRMTALDSSKKALAVARKNFKLFGLSQKIRTVESRFFGRFGDKKALWDIVVSNPPYIPTRELPRLSREVRNESRLALDGGSGGLDVIDAILKKAPRFLKPGGFVLLEIGKGQSKALAKKWAASAAYASLRFEKDLNGIDRILIAQAHG